jgi:hypothetical protein
VNTSHSSPLCGECTPRTIRGVGCNRHTGAGNYTSFPDLYRGRACDDRRLFGKEAKNETGSHLFERLSSHLTV